MPAKVTVSRDARADLVDIEHYLTINASPAVAERVVSRILDRLDRLTHQPGTGALRPDIGEDCRSMIARPYLVIYEVQEIGEDTIVAILRIIHGSRDLPTLFDPG